MRAALAIALLAAFSSPASAHCYQIWHYRQPQRCRVTTIAVRHAWRPPVVMTSAPQAPVAHPDPQPLPASKPSVGDISARPEEVFRIYQQGHELRARAKMNDISTEEVK